MIINSLEKNSARKLGMEIYRLGRTGSFLGVDVLCIGTDRATGDSLGPLAGEIARRKIPQTHDVRVFGTLDKPVHAANIVEKISQIDDTRLLIAVDASLGNAANVGCVTVGRGSVAPGASLEKNLPAVGDIFITGVVNTRSGQVGLDGATLSATRLSVVIRMARVIAKGLLFGVGMLCYEKEVIEVRSQRSENQCLF